jgi:hypothetical protein
MAASAASVACPRRCLQRGDAGRPPNKATRCGQITTRATRGEETFKICELIRDQRGVSWPHVSAWYWSGMLGQSALPWWSFVVAERE